MELAKSICRQLPKNFRRFRVVCFLLIKSCILVIHFVRDDLSPQSRKKSEQTFLSTEELMGSLQQQTKYQTCIFN